MKHVLPAIVCVGCGRRQAWNGDFGTVGLYAHCPNDDCRDKALSMLDEDRLFGLSDSDDENFVIPFPPHLNRAA